MRITQNMRTQTAVNDLQSRMTKLDEAQRQATTGKRIMKPSDDPVRAYKAINARSDIALNEQYLQNMEDATSYLNKIDNELMGIEDLLNNIRGLAVKYSNDSFTEENRKAGAMQLNELTSELISRTNSTYRGKYLFGGFSTLSQPFKSVLDEEGNVKGVAQQMNASYKNPVYGLYTEADGKNILQEYDVTGSLTDTKETKDVTNWITGDVKRQITAFDDISISISGGDLFQPGGAGKGDDLFQILINLRDSLWENDSDKVAASIDSLDNAKENVVSLHSMVGARIQRLDQTDFIMRSRNVQLNDSLGEYEDVDLAEALLEFQQEQVAFQSALTVTSQLTQQNLLSFLK